MIPRSQLAIRTLLHDGIEGSALKPVLQESTAPRHDRLIRFSLTLSGHARYLEQNVAVSFRI